MKKIGTLQDALASVGLNLERDRLVLFGSRAQGKASPDSDWDICVVGPRTKLYGSSQVQLVPRSLKAWNQDDFYGTELAACMAVYGVPLSHPLPKVERLDYVKIKERALAQAQRTWRSWLRREQAAGASTYFEFYRRKAATSALLATRYYSRSLACPARSVLIEHWETLSPMGRGAIIEEAGLPASAVPDTIDIRAWRNNIFRRGQHEQDREGVEDAAER